MLTWYFAFDCFGNMRNSCLTSCYVSISSQKQAKIHCKIDRMKKYYFTAVFIFVFLSLYSQKEADTVKRIKFAAIPIVNYSNTTGASFGVLGQMFYKVNQNDTVSPTSSTGVFGIFTTNHTYFAVAFQRLYLKEDNWRIMLAAGLGNINFQYW